MTNGNIPQDASTPSVDVVLAEATGIATKAHDDTLEIDWSQEPANQRERLLRRAWIDRVARKSAENDAFIVEVLGFERAAATFTLTELRLLAPGAELVGSDLSDAIERWEALAREEQARNEATRHKRMLDAARQDVNDGAAA